MYSARCTQSGTLLSRPELRHVQAYEAEVMNDLNARYAELAYRAPNVHTDGSDVVQNYYIRSDFPENPGEENLVRGMREILRMPKKLAKKAVIFAQRVGAGKLPIVRMNLVPAVLRRIAIAAAARRQLSALAYGRQKVNLVAPIRQSGCQIHGGNLNAAELANHAIDA
jgi:hypothetical protein